MCDCDASSVTDCGNGLVQELTAVKYRQTVMKQSVWQCCWTELCKRCQVCHCQCVLLTLMGVF